MNTLLVLHKHNNKASYIMILWWVQTEVLRWEALGGVVAFISYFLLSQKIIIKTEAPELGSLYAKTDRHMLIQNIRQYSHSVDNNTI